MTISDEGIGEIRRNLNIGLRPTHVESQQLLDEVVRLRAESAELRKATDKLPKTADGVVIAPGDRLWCIRTARWKWIGEKGTASYRGIESYAEYPDGEPVFVSHIGAVGSRLQQLAVVRGWMSYQEMTLPEWLFSSKEAVVPVLLTPTPRTEDAK